jgi:AraC-like DNA-binding protein
VHFTQHAPGGRLTTSVKAIWRARGTQSEFSAPEPIVPDGCVEIVLNLGDRFRDEAGELQPRALLAGQMTRPVVARPTGRVDLIGIRFFPGRAGSALRTPMWQLQDCLLDAAAIVPGLDRVVDDLADMPDARRLEHLDHALVVPARDCRSHDVDHAIELIDRAEGNITVEAVARSVGITRRHLERRFKDEVGLGVKQMARITRVHAALRLIEGNPEMSGAEVSAHCGYSDQAHLIRECKGLTGRTPARLMTSERSLAGLMREAAASRSA